MSVFLLFFFNDTATTEIYTLSLHDALPISFRSLFGVPGTLTMHVFHGSGKRSEEHTSELQSRFDIVCRLLLEKKNPRRSRYLPAPSQSASASPCQITHAS